MSKIGESMRALVLPRSLAQYVTDVQAGRDPHPVNTKGSEDRISRAVDTLRNTVRPGKGNAPPQSLARLT